MAIEARSEKIAATGGPEQADRIHAETNTQIGLLQCTATVQPELYRISIPPPCNLNIPAPTALWPPGAHGGL